MTTIAEARAKSLRRRTLAVTPRRPPLGNVAQRVTTASLGQLAGYFAVAGLTEWGDLLIDTLAAHRDLVAEAEADDARITTRRRELVAGIAEGDISPTDAAVALAEVERATADAPTARRLFAEAKRHILAKAVGSLYEAGDALIGELDAVVTAGAAEALTVAPKAAGIDSDSASVRADAPARTAWATITAALERSEASWSAARLLRLHGIVADIPSPLPGYAWQYRNLEPVHTGIDKARHPNHGFLALTAAGARPGALTAAEVADLHLESPDSQPPDPLPAA